MAAPRLRLREIEAFERPMPFSRPFRFGAVTVEAAPQAFVRVVAEVEGRSVSSGASAEMMMPKWFDKNPAKTPAETINDLRASLRHAARLYGHGGRETAFGLHAMAYREQMAWAERHRLPALVGAYGPALIDKAVLDALLKALGAGLVEGLRANASGLDTRLTPDLDEATLSAFLRSIQPSPEIAIRHTIGIVDPIEGENGLKAELASADLRFFKIKLGGDLRSDLDRLRTLARVLPACVADFAATLDGNEQYDPERLSALVEALSTDRALWPLRERLLHVEQPLDRAVTLATSLGEAGEAFRFIIDEADDAYDAFPRAAALGYRGVSSKSCKGLHKALLNAARAKSWNARDGRPGYFFLSGEDLTSQAGLAVQQDTALVAALGLGHVERNGHHYVDGFGPAPLDEAAAFARAHPDLYASEDGRWRLAVASGSLRAACLFAKPGFAGGAEPDWRSLQPLASASALQELPA